MFQVGEIVVHKRDICKVTEIINNFRPDEDFYTLVPLDDGSLVIHTPVLDKRGLIRSVISREAAEILIQEIPKIEDVKFDDDRMLESSYVTLVNSGRHGDLIKIIKTTYLRKEAKETIGKKVGEKDKSYFKLAEKLLYSELAIALGMTYQETKQYVENKVAELIKE